MSRELPGLGRYWLGVTLIVVILGPVLAVAGIGGSLWGLGGFLVIFGFAVPLISRGLRPPVRLVASSQNGTRVRSAECSHREPQGLFRSLK